MIEINSFSSAVGLIDVCPWTSAALGQSDQGATKSGFPARPHWENGDRARSTLAYPEIHPFIHDVEILDVPVNLARFRSVIFSVMPRRARSARAAFTVSAVLPVRSTSCPELQYAQRHGSIGLIKSKAFKRVSVHWAVEYFD